MNIGIIGQGFVGNAVYQKFKNIREKYPTSKDYWRSYLKMGYYSINCEYVKRIKYYKSVFNTLPIVSEDLWGGKNDSLAKLSNFLQYDIKKLWPNCYYPEMGTKTPVLERKWNLSDQWGSDLEDLTDEDLSFGRKYLAKYYDECMICLEQRLGGSNKNNITYNYKSFI